MLRLSECVIRGPAIWPLSTEPWMIVCLVLTMSVLHIQSLYSKRGRQSTMRGRTVCSEVLLLHGCRQPTTLCVSVTSQDQDDLPLHSSGQRPGPFRASSLQNRMSGGGELQPRPRQSGGGELQPKRSTLSGGESLLEPRQSAGGNRLPHSSDRPSLTGRVGLLFYACLHCSHQSSTQSWLVCTVQSNRSPL